MALLCHWAFAARPLRPSNGNSELLRTGRFAPKADEELVAILTHFCRSPQATRSWRAVLYFYGVAALRRLSNKCRASSGCLNGRNSLAATSMVSRKRFRCLGLLTLHQCDQKAVKTQHRLVSVSSHSKVARKLQSSPICPHTLAEGCASSGGRDRCAWVMCVSLRLRLVCPAPPRTMGSLTRAVLRCYTCSIVILLRRIRAMS